MVSTAVPGSHVGTGKALKASKREPHLEMRLPNRDVRDDDVDRLQV